MDLAPVPQEPTAGLEWDTFIERGGGRFAHAYHLTAWREVHRRAYGREPVYLAARGAGGERRLSSVIRGGPVASDVEARSELLAAACRMVDEQGFADLTIETDVPGCEQLVPGLRAAPDSPAWLTPLPGDADELLKTWRKRSRNLWRNLAKATDRVVVVPPVASRMDLWRFYRQYVLAMRAGTGPFHELARGSLGAPATGSVEALRRVAGRVPG